MNKFEFENYINERNKEIETADYRITELIKEKNIIESKINDYQSFINKTIDMKEEEKLKQAFQIIEPSLTVREVEVFSTTLESDKTYYIIRIKDTAHLYGDGNYNSILTYYNDFTNKDLIIDMLVDYDLIAITKCNTDDLSDLDWIINPNYSLIEKNSSLLYHINNDKNVIDRVMNDINDGILKKDENIENDLNIAIIHLENKLLKYYKAKAFSLFKAEEVSFRIIKFKGFYFQEIICPVIVRKNSKFDKDGITFVVALPVNNITQEVMENYLLPEKESILMAQLDFYKPEEEFVVVNSMYYMYSHLE